MAGIVEVRQLTLIAGLRPQFLEAGKSSCLFCMNIGTLMLVALDVLTGGTRERRTNSPCAVTIDDIHNTRVGSTNQEYQANQDDDCVQDGVADIFPAGSPASFLEQGEPENGWEVDGEAADK